MQKVAQKCQYFALIDQSVPPDNCYVTCLLREKSALVRKKGQILFCYSLEKTLMYNFQHTAVWIFPPRTKDRAFVLIFYCKRMSLSDSKPEESYKVTGKKIQILLYSSN